MELDELKSQVPKAPKSYTKEEFESLSEGAQYTAKSRNVTYGELLTGAHDFRPDEWVALAKRRGDEFVAGLFESKEMWKLRMDWLREMCGVCQYTHWGVKLGLYCTLTEHMPTRQQVRISMAGSFEYDGDTDSYQPRILASMFRRAKNPATRIPLLRLCLPPLSRYFSSAQFAKNLTCVIHGTPCPDHFFIEECSSFHFETPIACHIIITESL